MAPNEVCGIRRMEPSIYRRRVEECPWNILGIILGISLDSPHYISKPTSRASRCIVSKNPPANRPPHSSMHRVSKDGLGWAPPRGGRPSGAADPGLAHLSTAFVWWVAGRAWITATVWICSVEVSGLGFLSFLPCFALGQNVR